ncbi:MAG: hypothetical protein H6842_11740 [Rhodospirillaceae bacterium]|nr:hypothetical protein [Rhodospirillaceae bacterium]
MGGRKGRGAAPPSGPQFAGLAVTPPLFGRLSSLAPEPGHRLAHGLLLALVLAGVSVGLRAVDPWPGQLDQPGWPYVAYHLLRVGLLLLLIPLVYGAGRLLLPGPRRMTGPILDRLGHFLACATVGVALISLVFSLCGMLALFTYPVFLAVGLALAAWSGLVFHEVGGPLRRWILARGRALRAAPLGADTLCFLLLAGLSVAILATYGIAHVLTLPLENNDIPGGYLPYQEGVLRQTHGFWPTFRFPMFAVLKGAGWSFFVMGLSDHLASPVANFLLFALLLALIAQIGAWVCGSLRVAWLGALLLCLWPQGIQFQLSLFKTHTAIGAFLIAALYWMVLLLAGLKVRNPMPLRGLVITVAATVTLYPSNIFLIGIMLLAPAWVYARLHRLNAAASAVWAVAVWCALTLAVLLGYAYTTSGHFDFTFEALDAVADVDTLSEWGSLFILKLQRVLQGEFVLVPPTLGRTVESLGHVLDGSPARWRPLAILALLGAMLVGPALWRALRRRLGETPRPPHYAPACFLLLCGFGCCVALMVLVDHVSVIRTASFRFAYSALVLLWMGGWAAAALKGGGTHRRGIAVLVLLLLAAPLPQGPAIAARDWRFLAGRETFLSMIEAQWPGVTAYWQVSHVIAPGRRILMLNWEPGAFMLPGAPFERPFQNHAEAELPFLMYESADQGRAVLQRAGIETVSVNLNAPLIFTVLSPLFHPDALAEHFRLLAHLRTAGSDLYLLTLRTDQGTPLPADFRDRYARHVAQGRLTDHGFDRLYAIGECLWRLAQQPGQPGTDVGGPQNFLASPAQRMQCERDLTP